MDRVYSIRRIDILDIGPLMKIKISRKDGSSEDIGLYTDSNEGKEKLNSLYEFIKVFDLESRCFMISM